MDIEKVVQDPEGYFSSPAEVTTEPALTLEQKIRVLESWEVDVNRLLTSESENMPGDDDNSQNTARLQEIKNTLDDLKSR